MNNLMYQGDIGSNSERAAQEITHKHKNLKINSLKPAISSKNVVHGLKKQACKYGVVAVYNNIGGTIKETRKALSSIDFEIIDFHHLTIDHVLCVKKNDGNDPIDFIYSHPQALLQCSDFISRHHILAETHSYSDTALAAKDLSNEKFSNNTAIICSPEAAKEYDLEILETDIANESVNQTVFALIKLK